MAACTLIEYLLLIVLLVKIKNNKSLTNFLIQYIILSSTSNITFNKAYDKEYQNINESIH
jgi:hypothetical protein